MGAILDFRDLTVSFGALEAVRGVSMSVDEGEVLGLAGESGSGKSATALAIFQKNSVERSVAPTGLENFLRGFPRAASASADLPWDNFYRSLRELVQR